MMLPSRELGYFMMILTISLKLGEPNLKNYLCSVKVVVIGVYFMSI